MISAGFQLSSASANSPFEQYSSKLPASVRGALNHTTGWMKKNTGKRFVVFSFLVDISSLSARFSRNGYCWLVSGQIAYVWLASGSNRITVSISFVHNDQFICFLAFPGCCNSSRTQTTGMCTWSTSESNGIIFYQCRWQWFLFMFSYYLWWLCSLLAYHRSSKWLLWC